MRVYQFDQGGLPRFALALRVGALQRVSVARRRSVFIDQKRPFSCGILLVCKINHIIQIVVFPLEMRGSCGREGTM